MKSEIRLGEEVPQNFVKDIIREDLEKGLHQSIVTRFPPEPNGHLHIGHAKSICLNFSLAREFKGTCHLRFDDTNPTTEDTEYVEAIQKDIKWLGFDWQENLFYASNYFDKLYELAEKLVKKKKAYVCHLDEEKIRTYRGSLTAPGQNSPYRERSVSENLELLQKMKSGEFKDGECVLRAKIDMAHPNLKMRDPLIYRIRHAHHYRLGDTWCIYPMYDFAHCLSDALEGITHSICTLEFENNREVYDWFVDECDVGSRPRQYEFARLNLNYTVLSKRKLIELVKSKIASGWDDPRLPTLAGLRRRGFTPKSIRQFCERIGVAKANSTVGMELLEYSIRDDLNQFAPRVMGVIDPVKVIITNYEKEKTLEIDAPYFPVDHKNQVGRKLYFSREIYIDRQDFSFDPPKKYFRLSPGKEVRLRYAFTIKCDEVITNEKTGEVIELKCSYDPKTLGRPPEDRKVKGIIHWVSADEKHHMNAEVRLYDRLFPEEAPDWSSKDELKKLINPQSLKVLKNCKLEKSLENERLGEHFQFERLGYFVKDLVDSKNKALVFNRVVTLKDTWAKNIQRPSKKESLISKESAPIKLNQPKKKKEKRRYEPEILDYAKKYQLKDSEANILNQHMDIKNFFEKVVSHQGNPPLTAKWMVNELFSYLKDQSFHTLNLNHIYFAQFIQLVDQEVVSSKMAKKLFSLMIERNSDPLKLIDEFDLKQISDSVEIEKLVLETLSQFPEELKEYQSGKKNLFGHFMGAILATKMGQKMNPKILNKILTEKLNSK